MFYVRARTAVGILIASLLLIGFVGCATSDMTSGKPIPQTSVDQIVDGQTTVEQIITMFGAPTQQSEMGGDTLYTYRYTQTKTSTGFMPYYTNTKGNTSYDELTVTFDTATRKVKAHSIQRGVQG
jgi:SmpA/OmlA family protein